MGSVSDKMVVFDALPLEIRQALHAATYSWPPHEMYERLEVGQSIDEVVALIRDLDEVRRHKRQVA